MTLYKKLLNKFKTFILNAKKHGNSINSISSVTIINIVGSVLAAIGGVLVARYIDPEVNGKFRIFTVPLMYLSFFHLGSFDGLWRQIPYYSSLDDNDALYKTTASAGAWNVFITYIAAVVFCLLSFWGLVQENYLEAAGWFSQAIASVGVYYGGYLSATYRTVSGFVVFARIQFIQSIATFIFVMFVVFLGFYGLCLRLVLPVVIFVVLLHIYRPFRISLFFDLASFKSLVKIGLPLCFWGTLYTSIWIAVEYSLMFSFGGTKAVGFLSVAIIIRESLCVIPNSFNQYLMPKAVDSFAKNGNTSAFAIESYLVTVITILITVIVVIISSFLLNYFVPMFIPKYFEGLTLIKTCIWFAVIQATSIPLNGLIASGRGWLYGKGILVGIIFFPLAVLLLNKIVGGILAVALGSLIGRFIRTSVAYFDLYKLMDHEKSLS